MIARRALLAAAALPATARAQPAFPNRPVRLIVPYSAGGVSDTVCRILQQKVGEQLGQPLIVENRTGASGAVGAAVVAQSPPDGYNLFADGATTITSPLVNRGLPVDYATFVPVTQITAAPYVLGIRADFPARDLAAFLDQARRRPGEITYGTPGVAHIGHLMGVLLEHLGQCRMVHVPYRGGADAARDLAGGRLDAVFISESSLQPVLASGRARPIGVTGAARRPNLPDTPAIGERLPGYDLATWQVIFAPAGTPPAVVERLSAAWRAVLRDPDIRARLDQTGNDAIGSTPAEAAAMVARDRGVLTALVRQAGLAAG